MRIFAIDPSVLRLGWVVMDPGTVVAFGTIVVPALEQKASDEKRLHWMLDALSDVAGDFEFDVVAIERPETWGAYKSMASSKSGSLQILTLLVGALVCWAFALGIEDVRLIKVSQHKGQLPKKVTQSRMEKKYHCSFETDHEADACSVGNFILETTNETKGR